MFKLTTRRAKELKEITHFIPSNCKWEEVKDSDIEDYFNKHERGTQPTREHDMFCRCGYCALCWGRIWRDRQIAIWTDFGD